MADNKISAFPLLPGADIATDDELAIVDASTGVTKKTTIDDLIGARDINLGSNYLLNDQTTTNMMSKGPAYRFDGVDDKVTLPSSTDLTFAGEFTVHAKVNIQTGDTFIGGSNTANYIGVAGARINSSTFAYASALPYDEWMDVTITRNSADLVSLYHNFIFVESATKAGEFSLSQGTFGTVTTNFVSGEMDDIKFFNTALTASEVKDLSANTPFKWIGASQTAQTSGVLVIGKEYIIDNWITADDFTNVGGANVDGTVFIATGTTPTTWTNSSSLRTQGVTADYPSHGISETHWKDVSGNANDGVNNGATVQHYKGFHSDGTDLFADGDFTSAGNLVIGTAGKGIDFNPAGTGAAANLLDDYEEGTWTPVLSDGTNDANMVLDNPVATYTKVGNLVTVMFDIQTSSLGSVSGALRVTGLPFTSSSASSGGVHTHFFSNGAITAGTYISGEVRHNQSYIFLMLWDGAGGTSFLLHSEWSDNGRAGFSGSYMV